LLHSSCLAAVRLSCKPPDLHSFPTRRSSDLAIDLGHVALMLLVAAIGAWIWRGMGLHDQALSIARRHCRQAGVQLLDESVALTRDRKSTRLHSSYVKISNAVCCLRKKRGSSG